MNQRRIKSRAVSRASSAVSVNIVRQLGGTGKYVLEISAIREIFCNETISGMKIAVISMSGAMHCGKSLTQNYFSDYLQRVKTCSSPRESEPPKRCFAWGNGMKNQKKTIGIHVSKAPVIFNIQGEKVAVFLLDAEGLNPKNGAEQHFIFALSTMLSSLQIINVQKEIQDRDVHPLKSFIAVYEDLKHSTESHVFENKLLFLVRDFANPSYQPGHIDGEQYIARLLQTSSKRTAFEKLKKSFSNLNFFFLPHPGSQATVKQVKNEFRGTYQELNKSFLHYLDELMGLVLAKDQLVVKRVNGSDISCSEYADHIEMCYCALTKMNPTAGLKKIIAHIKYQPLMEKCIRSFKESLTDNINQNAMEDDDFSALLEQIKLSTVDKFDEEGVGGSLEDEKQKFRGILERSLYELEDDVKEENKAKYQSCQEKSEKALQRSKKTYLNGLQKMISQQRQPDTGALMACHEKAKKDAISRFDTSTKQGGERFNLKFRRELSQSIQEMFQEKCEELAGMDRETSRIETTKSVLIGENGGILNHFACSVNFPPACFIDDLQVSLTLQKEDAFWPADKYTQKSPLIVFEPRIAPMRTPATCTILSWYVSFSSNVRANDEVHVMQKSGQTWMPIHSELLKDCLEISCNISDLSPIALAISVKNREVATILYHNNEGNFKVFFFDMKNINVVNDYEKKGRFMPLSDINILVVSPQDEIEVTLSRTVGTIIWRRRFRASELTEIKSTTFAGPDAEVEETRTKLRYEIKINGNTRVSDEFGTNLFSPGRPDTAPNGPLVVNRMHNSIGGALPSLGGHSP